jgi:ribonuclease VapC
MIVDTSAVVAVVLDEPERAALLECLASAVSRTMSAASVVELIACYASRTRLDDPLRALQDDLSRLDIIVEPVTPEQALLACRARLRFGKGTGHPARLNYGDCFSYALAKSANLPLLFKGNDFGRTDVAVVRY